LKECELCGLDNPDEARFCMKCGRDLDKIKHEDPLAMDEYDGFIPAATLDDARFGSTAGVKHDEPGPMPDFATYVPQPSVIQQQEYEEEAVAADESPEIQQQGITTDFTEKQTFCDRCGVRNAHDQKFCRHCGSPMGEATEEYSPLQGGPGPPPASMATIDTAPVELTSLTSISPSSDFYSPTVQEQKQAQSGGRIRGRSRARRMPTEGLTAKRLIAAIVAIVVIAGLLWLFAFGGLKMFSSSVRNIKKAGGVMTKLTAFSFSVGAVVDANSVESPGSGDIKYEAPDRSAWGLATGLPGKPPTTVILVGAGGKGYTNNGSGWQQSSSAMNVGMLWGGVSSADSLGMANVGAYSCYHYKYNTSPVVFTSMLGDPKPTGVSDAVVEIWIDSSNFYVRQMTANVYNAVVQGSRANVTFNMSLTSTGQPFNIKAPI
jgi:ribosomal protein L40E